MIVDDLVVQDCERYPDLLGHLPFKKTPNQRVNIQNFIPNRNADEHILSLEVELYQLSWAYERNSLILWV